MARRSRRRGTGRRDGDAAWKMVLQALLEDFIVFVHPDLHAAIDWTRPPDFLDKEIQAVARRAATGHRYVDLLAMVWLRDGREQWLLIHVEVQAQPEEGFAERMYLYYALLFLRHRRPVVSLAVLVDGRDDWRPAEYAQDHWGCTLRFRYPAVKLLDWRGREEELARLDNPFAQVALAQLTVLAAGKNLEPLAAVRRTILRRLVRAGYGEARIVAVITFLDWALGLPDDLAAQIDAEVAAAEGVTMAQLMTRWELRGWERGRVQGQQELLLRQLERRLGPLDGSVQARLGALNGEQLGALGESLFDFATRADLDQWLATQAPVTPE